MTTGSSGGFLLAFLAAFDVGSRVGLARPGYPAYRNILHALGCEVVDLPCGPETRYQPTAAMIDGLGLDGLIVASPANPTGTMLAPAELAAAGDRHCAQTGVRLISDEIYHGITYAGETSCSWATDRSGFVVNSFTKYFSMTGWRIGWLLVPPDLVDVVDALAGNLAICPPALAQYAALAAFDSYDECDATSPGMPRTGRCCSTGCAGWASTGWHPPTARSTCTPTSPHLTDDSAAFCARLLAETGVAAAPGIDFDPVDGHRFLRFSFAGSTSAVTGALDALQAFLPGF